MNLYLGAAVLCLATWAFLVYVVAIPSSWVHVLLAGGFVLVARGIVGRSRR
jgi:hypothetical protein